MNIIEYKNYILYFCLIIYIVIISLKYIEFQLKSKDNINDKLKGVKGLEKIQKILLKIFILLRDLV